MKASSFPLSDGVFNDFWLLTHVIVGWRGHLMYKNYSQSGKHELKFILII